MGPEKVTAVLGLSSSCSPPLYACIAYLHKCFYLICRASLALLRQIHYVIRWTMRSTAIWFDTRLCATLGCTALPLRMSAAMRIGSMLKTGSLVCSRPTSVASCLAVGQGGSQRMLK